MGGNEYKFKMILKEREFKSLIKRKFKCFDSEKYKTIELNTLYIVLTGIICKLIL